MAVKHKDLKKVASELEGAVKAHGRQAKTIKQHIKDMGSSFKMKKVKDLYSTDIYGRPYGFNKVSIIDSTVLPTLPSNTHTLLTMCNSYRITEKVIADFF